jgi:hypothetical protein
MVCKRPLLRSLSHVEGNGTYALGSPSPRWAMMLRWISDVPAAMVADTDDR